MKDLIEKIKACASALVFVEGDDNIELYVNLDELASFVGQVQRHLSNSWNWPKRSEPKPKKLSIEELMKELDL